MVLTSLSTEQMIGVNANTYVGNFSIIAWTVQSVIPLCILAKVLLPKYLREGYTTIPEFFENRYARSTRLVMSTLFLFFYIFISIPVALYTGAQNKMMMYFMPLFIGYISLTFPAGLVLYWVVMNIMQIAQQSIMNRAAAK